MTGLVGPSCHFIERVCGGFEANCIAGDSTELTNGTGDVNIGVYRSIFYEAANLIASAGDLSDRFD